MDWLFLMYLLYVIRTRGSQTKSCANCKFFLPPTDDHSRPQRLGKCLLYPYPENTVTDLIVGMSHPNYTGQYRYAVSARIDDQLCGVNAVHFSPARVKPPPPLRK